MIYNNKRKKILISSIIINILTVATLNNTPVYADTITTNDKLAYSDESSYLSSQDVDRGTLNGLSSENAETEIYSKIYDSLSNLDTEVDLSSYRKDSDYVFSILKNVLNDHPEIFYFDYSKCLYGGGRLNLGYEYDNTIIGNMKANLNNQINTFLSDKIKTSMSELEKEKAVHDYLVLTATYDIDNYNNNTIPNISTTAYGIIVNKTGVCEGYAKAMKLLLNKVGIESIFLSGDPYMNHAWNLVKIDGSWYHTDVTWDDPVPDKGTVRYKYFNLDDASMLKDHSWEQASYLTCTSNKYLYMQNISYPVQDGNVIYYSDSSTDKLTKINLDGTDKKVISDDRALYLCSSGEWIYYSNYSNGGYLCKIKKDGTNKQVLNSSHSTNLYVKDGLLYYTNEKTQQNLSIKIDN